jgi:hypothetical protein
MATRIVTNQLPCEASACSRPLAVARHISHCILPPSSFPADHVGW